MNTRELRIGSYVNVQNVGMVTVNGITQHKIGYCPKPNYEKYAMIREVEPIELTAELMAHLSIDDREFMECIVIIQHEDVYNDGGKVEVMVSCISPRVIKYLHELQNVYFWFTGTELKIKSHCPSGEGETES